MKICPKCNAQLADDSVFCTGCGQKIEEDTAAQAANVCKNCGSPLSSDTQFCTKCGTPVEIISNPSLEKTTPKSFTDPSPAPSSALSAVPIRASMNGVSAETSDPPQEEKKKPAVFIGSFLFFFLLLGGILYFNTGDSNEKPNIPKTAEDFVRVYNHEIEGRAKANGVDVKAVSLESVPIEMKEILNDAVKEMGISNPPNGEMTFAEAAGGKILFVGGKTTDGVLHLVFQMRNGAAQETGSYYSAMEGLIKASGGDIEPVMKGLGLHADDKYQIPADYTKEYVYNNTLKYVVLSMGSMVRFGVEVRNKNISKPSAPTDAIQPSTPQPVISVDADQMIDEYLQNQNNAEKKYKNTTVHITGQVLHKGKFNNSEKYYIRLASRKLDDMTYTVLVNIGDNMDAFNSVEKGDYISAQGKCVGIVPQKNNPNRISIQIKTKKITK